MIFFLLPSLTWAKPDPCLTIELEKIGLNEFHRVIIPPPSDEKFSRDAYQLANERFSDNFALRWGDNSVSDQNAIEILETLEHAWAVQINEMGYPQPVGSESTLFNVYIGDTGGPVSHGVSGYFTGDIDGWPMVVVSPNLLNRFDEYKSTLPHEFFHAVQNSADNWDYDEFSGWFWESTAVYMEYEADPTDPMYSVFLFGFAFLPHKALNFFDYFDTGSLQEYYQYGAFIFSKYLTEYHIDADWIRDAWVSPGDSPDPLTYLRDRYRDEGLDFETLVVDFASKNAVLDYEHQEWYRYYLDYYADYYPGDDHRISAGISAMGSQGWKSPNQSLLPERYGFNHLKLENPNLDRLIFEFEGETRGSQDSSAQWHVRLSRQTNEELKYEDMPISDAIGSMTVSNLNPQETLIWTVMPVSGEYRPGETFAYRYKVSEPMAEEETEADPKERNCSGCREGNAAALVGPLLLLVRCRRRVRPNLQS